MLDRRDDATERLLAFAETIKQKGKVVVVDEAWRKTSVEDRLAHRVDERSGGAIARAGRLCRFPQQLVIFRRISNTILAM